MSLLLDALHRASKEKGKLTDPTAAAIKPSVSSSGAVARTPLPSIPESPAPPNPPVPGSGTTDQPKTEAESSPYLVLDFESVAEPNPTPPAPEPETPLPLLESLTFSVEPLEPTEAVTVVSASGSSHEQATASKNAEDPAEAVLEIAYEIVEPPVVKPPVAEPTVAEPPPSLIEAPRSPPPAPEPPAPRPVSIPTPIVPVRAAEPPPPPQTRVEPVVVAAVPITAPPPPSPTGPATSPSQAAHVLGHTTPSQAAPSGAPSASPRTVSEILSATKAKAKVARQKPSKRLVAMGSVALILAVATGGLFLGVWERLLGLSNPQLNPVPQEDTATTNPADATPVAEAEAPATPTPGVAVTTDQPSPPTGQEPNRAPTEVAATTTAAPVAQAMKAIGAAKAMAEDATRTIGEQVKALAAPTENTLPQPVAAEKPLFSKTSSGRTASERKANGTNQAPKALFTAKPGTPSTLDQGYTALTEGRLDVAAEAYRRSLKNNPDERDALLGLAHIAQRQGRLDEARSYYQRVLRQEPANPTANAGLLSMASEGDLQAATSRGRDLAERNPDSAATFSALGGVLARDGRMADAQQAYFKALALEPNEAIHAYNLAVALDRLHKPSQARGYYERALVLARKSGADVQDNFPLDATMRRIEQLRSDQNEAPADTATDTPK